MKYSIGIDLGTTNTALAYVPLDQPDAQSQVLPLEQQVAEGAQAHRDSVPSFLFRPALHERGSSSNHDWIVGCYARERAADRPDAVVHSAKSWLGHHQVDRTKRILPWGSNELSPGDKLSPIEASTRILEFLRDRWNEAMASNESENRFENQQIVLTVPASFDAAAQELTLKAARSANYPNSVTLLEEPQAAFYHWLEQHPKSGPLSPRQGSADKEARHLLVVDIGGGTSDFSLFQILPDSADIPIKRTAVSDHILLGGDNIDLAIAHQAEKSLGLSRRSDSLTPRQWAYLVARCRDLKEQSLATKETESASSPPQEFTFSIPGTGSGLVAGTMTGSLTSQEIIDLVLKGFFPKCERDERPLTHQGGLQELGLPYARDGAITRHLAAFLRDRPPPQAILFNGGTLRASRLQEQIIGQLAHWQEGQTPEHLVNTHADLAVARGAAFYGADLNRGLASRIQAGAARSIYLEVANTPQSEDTPNNALVCVLPRDTPPEQTVVVDNLKLELQTNTPVQFQTWQSSRRKYDAAGQIVTLQPGEFSPLPPLQTVATLDSTETTNTPTERVPIRIQARLTNVGILELECCSTAPSISTSWPLKFETRGSKRTSPAGDSSSGVSPQPTPDHSADEDRGITPAQFTRAEKQIRTLLETGPSKKVAPLTSTSLIKALEKCTGLPKHEWNGALARGLWPTVNECFSCRERSVQHEEAWISLAGYLLRPGWGAPFDEDRVHQLWQLHENGPAFSNKSVRIQTFILWRRVAGGLSAVQQKALIRPHWETLHESKSPAPELILLAGSLERLELEEKRELVRTFSSKAVEKLDTGAHGAPYLTALSRLLSRTPMSVGPEHVLPADDVSDVFDQLKRFDWTTPPSPPELTNLFLRAARLTGERHLDVARSVRRAIITKLEKAGIASVRLTCLDKVTPFAKADQRALFGESLPPGISLGGN